MGLLVDKSKPGFSTNKIFVSKRIPTERNGLILASSRFIFSLRRCNKIIRLAFSDRKDNIKNKLLPPSKKTFYNLTTLVIKEKNKKTKEGNPVSWLENDAHHTGVTLQEYLPWISFKTKRTRKRMRGPSAGPRFRKRAAEKGDAFLNLVKKRVVGGEKEERKVTATVG
ncbi:hypothetical protein HZH66_000855 [Vespula vulgaris]|uniref:Uncharacterized protein n=1 Tax=Vespula vulgaris TaxID=7454 RepID=A0A834KVC4_VESVU|nr:hypothetical protein HZH66_000855 [Vespula vulgaris]